MIIGHHCTWDVYNCQSDKLCYVPYIEEVLNKVVEELKLTKVNSAFKQFEPVGVTGFILLSESHISIHTWPEHNFAAIDVFSCQSFNVEMVNTMLKKFLGSDKVECQQLHRGGLPKPHLSNDKNLSVK